MNLIESFKVALAQSNTTHLEMQWNLKVDPERFQALINGIAEPNEHEELIMLRLILKQREKPNHILTAIDDPLI